MPKRGTPPTGHTGPSSLKTDENDLGYHRFIYPRSLIANRPIHNGINKKRETQ